MRHRSDCALLDCKLPAAVPICSTPTRHLLWTWHQQTMASCPDSSSACAVSLLAWRRHWSSPSQRLNCGVVSVVTAAAVTDANSCCTGHHCTARTLPCSYLPGAYKMLNGTAGARKVDRKVCSTYMMPAHTLLHMHSRDRHSSACEKVCMIAWTPCLHVGVLLPPLNLEAVGQAPC